MERNRDDSSWAGQQRLQASISSRGLQWSISRSISTFLGFTDTRVEALKVAILQSAI